MFDFFEFFAGAGMVRAGLGGTKWRCRFANDFDHKKSAVYRRNWGGGVLQTADIRTLTTKDAPGNIDLAWGFFPLPKTFPSPVAARVSKATGQVLSGHSGL